MVRAARVLTVLVVALGLACRRWVDHAVKRASRSTNFRRFGEFGTTCRRRADHSVKSARRWVTALPVVMGFWALGAACVAPVSEAGRSCPCSPGWQCCAGVCVGAQAECAPAHQPNARYTSLPAGAALDLGPFRCESLAGEATNECLSLTDDAALRYDSVNHRVWLLGRGHSANDSLFVFDPDTAQWSAAYAPTECSERAAGSFDVDAGAWVTTHVPAPTRPLATSPKDRLVFVPTTRELVLLGRGPAFIGACMPFGVESDEGRVAHWSYETKTWSFSPTALPDARPDSPGVNTSWEFDAASNTLVAVSEVGLFTYDPSTRVKRHVFTDFGVGDLGYSNELVAAEDAGFFYFERSPAKVFHLEYDAASPLNSVLREVTTTGPKPTHDEPGYAYDRVHRRIGGAVKDSTFFTFDPVTATFASSTLFDADGGRAAVGTMQAHCIAFDEVNGVYDFITTGADGYHTWAFRPPAN